MSRGGIDVLCDRNESWVAGLVVSHVQTGRREAGVKPQRGGWAGRRGEGYTWDGDPGLRLEVRLGLEPHVGVERMDTIKTKTGEWIVSRLQEVRGRAQAYFTQRGARWGPGARQV